MKSFIFVLCLPFLLRFMPRKIAFLFIDSSAELACKNNPNAASKESCKERLLSTAGFGF
ncbi:hypothetical protein LQQ69_26495 (plasmid) [Escherichia coli]|nr:hypothetical protein LQQ69_26495 [Escherichia coli]